MRAGSRAGRLEQARPGQVQHRAPAGARCVLTRCCGCTVCLAHLTLHCNSPFLRRYLRAIGHLSNGVDPMEPNAEFADELEKAAGAVESGHRGLAAQ